MRWVESRSTKMMPEYKMEDRVILYIDVLGFSDFVNNSKPDDLEEFLKWYDEFFTQNNFHTNTEMYDDNYGTLGETSTIFSDSIIKSWPKENIPHFDNVPERFQQDKRTSPLQMFYRVWNYQQEFLIRWGLLIRGILHFGQIYHRNHIVMGKGFVEAVNYEKTKCYPAIYLSPEYCEKYSDFLKRQEELPESKRRIKISTEGYYVYPATLKTEEHYHEILGLIKKNIEETTQDKVRDKWKWLEETLTTN